MTSGERITAADELAILYLQGKDVRLSAPREARPAEFASSVAHVVGLKAVEEPLGPLEEGDVRKKLVVLDDQGRSVASVRVVDHECAPECAHEREETVFFTDPFELYRWTVKHGPHFHLGRTEIEQRAGIERPNFYVE